MIKGHQHGPLPDGLTLQEKEIGIATAAALCHIATGKEVAVASQQVYRPVVELC